MFKITKILNHNVVCCERENSKNELIAFGKGIGFQKKIGDFIIEANIQNLYEIHDIKDRNRYEQLVQDVDEEILDISEEIISDLANTFEKEYDKRIHIALLDHIQFSVKRYRENITIQNVFLEETQYLYPQEFSFSKMVLKKINQRLNIHLPQSELGFICMHIHAALHGEEPGFSSIMVQILSESIMIIERELQVNLNDYEVSKQRLVTHLKFAIKRSVDHIELENLLSDVIHKKYQKTYEIACMICHHIHEKYGIDLGEGEKCYLTIHLQNIVMYKQ